MSAPKIPKKVLDFGPYINDTFEYLSDITVPEPSDSPVGYAESAPLPEINWQRLGLQQKEFSMWRMYREHWNTLFPKYTHKKATLLATSITDQLNAVQDNFIDFAQPLLNRIEYSPNVIMHDMEVFHIMDEELVDDVHAYSREPITEDVTFP